VLLRFHSQNTSSFSKNSLPTHSLKYRLPSADNPSKTPAHFTPNKPPRLVKTSGRYTFQSTHTTPGLNSSVGEPIPHNSKVSTYLWDGRRR
ncbi:hypothetical protein CDAR_51831, partial [Caerostris darwini]